MPRREKINLEKVKASLSVPYPECGHTVSPAELLRIDSEQVRCPKCGAIFKPLSREKSNSPK